MGFFRKALPYPKEVLEFVHNHFGGENPQPKDKQILHSVLQMEEMYIDTIGITDPSDNSQPKPILYLTTKDVPGPGNLSSLEEPYAWMPLIWVILRLELLPKALEMFGPDMEVVIEGENSTYVNTIGGLLEIIENNYFEYWKH